MSKTPTLFIFAGVNGAGKSTLSAKIINQGLEIVNPDVIAAMEKISMIQAGKKALKQRENLLKLGKSFAIETTLTGKGEINFIRKAKDVEFKICIFYIIIKEVLQSKNRVALRVAQGGHFVPTKDINRRFNRSLDNLKNVLDITDKAYIIDNSMKNRKLLAKYSEDTVVLSRVIPNWIKKYLII